MPDVTVAVTGLDQFTAKIDQLARGLPEAVGAALYREMLTVMADSQEIVPFLEGDLHDSGEVEHPEIGGSTVRVGLHYGSASVDYALKQHEDLSLRHPNGGQAKFLEQPLHQWSDDGPARVVRAAIRGAGR